MSLIAIVVSDEPMEGSLATLGWHVTATPLPHDITGHDAVERARLLRTAAHDLRLCALAARDGPGSASPPAFRTPTAAGTYVSLSHTDGAIAVALAARPVGVDVERCDRAMDATRLAARYFAQGEDDGFIWRWTAKEALMKATGLSLRAALATPMGPEGAPPFARTAAGAEITVFAPFGAFALAVARC